MSLRVPSDSTLTPTQRRFLDVFFGKGGAADGFSLAGGTALAGFHLAHRYSDDIDLFCYEREVLIEGSKLATDTVLEVGLTLIQKDGVPETEDMIRLNLEGDPEPQHPLLKVELVRDTPPIAAPPVVFEGIRVMGIRDIAAAKMLALGARMEPRDFVDLYFISEQGSVDLMEVLPLALEKGPGLSGAHIATSLWNVDDVRGVKKYLDRYAVKTVDQETLRTFCRGLAKRIFDLYGPPKS